MILNKIKSCDKKVAFYMTTFYSHHRLNGFMKFISSCGDFGLIWLILILASNLSKYTRVASIDMLIALITSTLIGQVTIKTIVKRKRPCHTYPNVDMLVTVPNDYSFPSGHTITSFACSTVIFFFFPIPGIIAYIYAFLTGISRMYLFVHYLSDVMVAMILGIIIGYIVCFI